MARSTAALAGLAALLFGSVPAAAQPAAFDVAPWLEDLAVVRTAVETKYANLEWQMTERELDVAALFDRAGTLLRGARSDADARALFDRLAQRFADGHVYFSWPPPAPAPTSTVAGAPAPPAPPPTAESFCRARGYSPSPPGFAPALPGYRAIGSGDFLQAGTVPAAGTRVGIVRIHQLHPHVGLSLCTGAVAALAIDPAAPCDEGCADRLVTHAYRALTAAFADRLARLRAAGAELLVVDVAGNGGGSEWTEVAARMLSRRPLQSARLGFVRGAHWARLWREQAGRLRGFAAAAPAADRARLLAWAAEADAARIEAERSCPPTGDADCLWLGRAGFSTGLVGAVPAGAFDGRDWAVHLFNPSQHPYRDGVWDGPVVVLVDGETWSAAEQFAALLQDNRAALIVGARTGGSGCGHSWGGTPTRLPNRGATLNLPDCARFRADGSNEVRGVIPDLPVPWLATDGRAFRARLLEAALPEAIARARALHAAQ